MTTTYDPFHPRYLDEADLREELTRVFDLCHGCRLCFKYCEAFPTLFELIDRHEDQDAARLSDAEQDRVVEQCFGCKLCYVNCPYTPGQSEWNLDFPRLMLRAHQTLHRSRRRPFRTRLASAVLGRTDLMGRLGTRLAPLLNRALQRPGSMPRRAMERTVGIASQRLLPPYSRTRFSTWFSRRGESRVGEPAARVALFATCAVEYHEPALGRDLVGVYERNRVECSLPQGQGCCGAPLLHQGDIESFARQARRNVEVLSAAVREGRDVVVPQPTCSYVLKKDYPDYLGSSEAELVASRTYDAAEYLMRLHQQVQGGLDTRFEGEVPESVTYHAPCHLRAQNIGLKSRDLLKLTGAKVQVVAECSAIDGTWGLRAENYEMSRRVARKAVSAVATSGGQVLAGDCSLANSALLEETGRRPLHPLSLLARAYGLQEEP